MPEILGHNFIAGQRSAAGTTRLQSLDATTGEALPYQFTQATETEVDQAARRHCCRTGSTGRQLRRRRLPRNRPARRPYPG